MDNAIRWLVATAAAVLIVCLIIWARGEVNHRGDETGSLGIHGTVTSL